MVNISVIMHSISSAVAPFIPAIFIVVTFSLFMIYLYHRTDILKRALHIHSSDIMSIPDNIIFERRTGNRRHDLRRDYTRRIGERRDM